ncbi:MAG: hypothetical protein MJE68_17015 [Proteobacteria bacterium]|nr:hypothetical protein [Pseudomonadota bacterium]
MLILQIQLGEAQEWVVSPREREGGRERRGRKGKRVKRERETEREERGGCAI